MHNINFTLYNSCKTIQSISGGLLHISGSWSHSAFWLHALKHYQRHVIIVQKCTACCKLQLKPKCSIHYTYTQSIQFNQVAWCTSFKKILSMEVFNMFFHKLVRILLAIQNNSRKSFQVCSLSFSSLFYLIFVILDFSLFSHFFSSLFCDPAISEWVT